MLLLLQLWCDVLKMKMKKHESTNEMWAGRQGRNRRPAISNYQMTIPSNGVLIVVVKPLRHFSCTESHNLYLARCAVRYRSKHLIWPECRWGGTSPLASDCGGATNYECTIVPSLYLHSHDMVKIDHSLMSSVQLLYITKVRLSLRIVIWLSLQGAHGV